MAKIFCIGETVYDIIFKNFKPETAKAGGSMLNSTVSLGRMLLPVYFISEYGNDMIGCEIDSFLKKNNVNTDFVYRYTQGKTSIALAFLNEQNDANYSFYKELPETRLEIDWPEVSADDYVLFGSYYSINKQVRKKLKSFIEKANCAGATIIYDPNFRKAHLHEINDLLPYIIENMSLATIVRGSHEDFQMIFNTQSVEEAYKCVSTYCDNLIYTYHVHGVYFVQPERKFFVRSKQITPISTIGAGDNFNAGVLTYLFQKKYNRLNINNLNTEQVEQLLNYGIEFASEVCLSYENYISNEFARNFLQIIR